MKYWQILSNTQQTHTRGKEACLIKTNPRDEMTNEKIYSRHYFKGYFVRFTVFSVFEIFPLNKPKNRNRKD